MPLKQSMARGRTQLPDGLREDDVLANEYRIGTTLGAGATAMVVAARHLLLGQQVAIKFLLVDPQDEADAVERFLHEARAAMRIQSEHVVRVHDVAVLASGVPYMVMEYLEGADLASVLAARKRLGLEEAVDCILEACEAISEAHGLGIVHRDLKPANLFLLERPGATPKVKVL